MWPIINRYIAVQYWTAAALINRYIAVQYW